MVPGIFDKLQRQRFAVKSSGGLEEYSPSALALAYYSELHPSAFFLAFHLVMLIMVALHAGSFCSPFLFSSGADSFDPALCSLIEQAAYSITAQVTSGITASYAGVSDSCQACRIS